MTCPIVIAVSLPHIVLTLTRRSVSGYDLNRVIRETVSHFWAADQAQLYRTLKKLEQEGRVQSREEPADRGPPRKVYRRTAAGRRELVRWLRGGPILSADRSPWMAQLVFLWEAEDAAATLAFLRELREHLREKADTFQRLSLVESATPTKRMSNDDFHGFLGLRLADEIARTRLQWCDWAIAELLNRHPDAEAGEPTSTTPTPSPMHE